MRRSLVLASFAASAVAFVLACTTSTEAPIEAADAGTLPDAEVETEAAPPAPPGDGNTGSPCTQQSDCKGEGADCILAIGDRSFPNGYCSLPCDPKGNKTGEKNASCPGTGAVCDPDSKRCLAGCTNKQGGRPCRSGYLCAYVGMNSAGACIPESYSQCDLTKRGSCPAGQVCIVVGYDPVGLCDDGCDLFAQDCGSGGGCYPTAVGEGHCAEVHEAGADGDACAYTNDCAAGLSCNDEGTQRFCRPLCGGPANKACTNGKKCIDLSPSANVSVAGVCAG